MQIITQLREILKGIDSQECRDDDGWWETRRGAEFGAGKLKEIEALVIPLWESHGRLLAELKNVLYHMPTLFGEGVDTAKQAITAAEQLTKGDA